MNEKENNAQTITLQGFEVLLCGWCRLRYICAYKEKPMTYQAPIEHKTSPYLFRQNVQFQDAEGNIYTKTLLSPNSQFGEEIFKLIYKELQGLEVATVLEVKVEAHYS